MDAEKSAVATFELDTLALTVVRAGTGAGTVASAPAGINCGGDCYETYAYGTVVTLSQTAAAGSSFAGWSGACTGTGACQVTIDAAKSVTASFNKSSGPYPLNVMKSGDGAGTIGSSPGGISCGTLCSSSYAAGTVVTLSVSTAGGSSFAGWGGACTGTALSCKLTMDSSKSVTASFGRNMPYVTVIKKGSGSGKVKSSPAGINCDDGCTGFYPYGSVVTLTATASKGSVFGGWSGWCLGTGTCNVAMNQNTAVVATFTASNGEGFYTLVPCRVLDTRNGTGPSGGPALGAEQTRTFQLAGRCGIPATARAVAVNVTVTQATAGGNLRLYPADVPMPLVSAINYDAGKTRANSATVGLSSSGSLAVRCSQSSGWAHFVLDVVGYYE
jgi:hypothetical protein